MRAIGFSLGLALSGWLLPSVANADYPVQLALDTADLAIPGEQRAPRPRLPSPVQANGALGLYDTSLFEEVEPNNQSLNATALTLNGGRALAQGTLLPVADVDFFSFQGTAGDKVFAATMTAFAGSTNSVLQILSSNGSTLLEADDDDGTFAATSSSIAGVTLPSTGVYFARVAHFSPTSDMKPYRLFLQLRGGSAVAEVEGNDVTPEPLPASGFVAGAISSATDAADRFSFSAQAGDTVYLSLDADPARTLAATWNPRLGIGLIGGFILVANDANATGPNSEALMYTVNEAGNYFVQVDPATPGSGAPGFTYRLNVSVIPRVQASASCQTYTSTSSTPLADFGLTTSSINVPSGARIADVNLSLNLSHAVMADLDIGLAGPNGSFAGMFNDVGNAVANTAGLTSMNLTIDDEAAIPVNSFNVLSNGQFTPENFSRMDFFDGMPANGAWTLNINDDTTGNTGTLNGWSLQICSSPAAPACAPGESPVTVYSSDFESGAAGFTSAGTLNEWELGAPTLAPLVGCASGTACFKTDLDGTYEALSAQTLRSPPLDLSNANLRAPITVEWAQTYQLENAVFDSYAVSAQPLGVPASARTLYGWAGPTMTFFAGSPVQTLNQVSGWGTYRADLSALLGQTAELTFSLTTDNSGQFVGVGIDDVRVTACRRAPGADLAIAMSDSPDPVAIGAQLSFAISALNAGPDAADTLQITDILPVELGFVSVSSSAGASCVTPAAGASGSVTCTWAGATPVGTPRTVNLVTRVLPTVKSASIANTARVSNTVNDPNLENNSALSTTALLSPADVSISKTDSRSSAIVGSAGSYTIVASNLSGPGQVSARVTDTFAANFQTPTFSVVAAGAASCGAAGAGNLNQLITLPVASSCTFTVNGTYRLPIGVLSNTAAIEVIAPSTDPVLENNSATDTTLLTSPATLSASKAVLGLASSPAGEQLLRYTIVIRNAGPAAQLDNPTDEFIDVLPVSWRMASFSASSGALSYDGDALSRTLRWNGQIDSAAQISIVLEGSVRRNAGASVVSNQGTVQFDADGNGTNEASARTDDPALGGAQDPTDFNLAGVLAIPVNSPWALLLLMLVMGGVAGWAMRR